MKGLKTSPRERMNNGFHDGLADWENKRPNRQFIPQGKLFCLPKWDSNYCKGYEKGYWYNNTKED